MQRRAVPTPWEKESWDHTARRMSGGRLNGEDLTDLYKADPQLVEHRLVTQVPLWKNAWRNARGWEATPGAIHPKDFAAVAKAVGMKNVVQGFAHDHSRSTVSPERAHELERRLGTWTPEELAQN